MTEGIDVSKGQAGMNFAAGGLNTQFVIVKSSGFNTGVLYEAGGYRGHVDKAKSSGRNVGHYYVPGKGNPTIQADYFVDHLYKFNVNFDILALDNEPLDGNAVYWRQDQVIEFLFRVHSRTGIPWARLWLYCPASLTRTNGPWNHVTDLGIKIWWSAYGRNTGVRDHEPALQGKIARWDIHQYSSRKLVSGMRVDANFSHHSIPELFAGTQTSSVPTPVVRPKSSIPRKPPIRWHWELPTHMVQSRIQRALKRFRHPIRYSGSIDGRFGTLSIKGIQISIGNVGYRGAVDGVPGPLTCHFIQVYAQQFGSYKGPIDSILGPNSWAGFALGLERP